MEKKPKNVEITENEEIAQSLQLSKKEKLEKRIVLNSIYLIRQNLTYLIDNIKNELVKPNTVKPILDNFVNDISIFTE